MCLHLRPKLSIKNMQQLATICTILSASVTIILTLISTMSNHTPYFSTSVLVMSQKL